MTILIDNKKVKFNYEILETLETGIELNGIEVKSLKNKRGNFVGAYVIIRGGEAFLVEADIPPYQTGNTPENYNPKRHRRLLLSKKELVKLADLDKNHHLTIAPLSLYNKGRFLKVEIAIARGKKVADKRQTIRKREDEREAHRTLKNIR